MILRKAIISNYKGIYGDVIVNFDLFNCIVGQNQAEKSTILKAMDVSLSETNLTRSNYNVQATDNMISVERFFDCKNEQYFLGEEILTTIEAKELTNLDNHLVWKKTWNVTYTNVAKHYYCKLTFDDMRMTWFDGTSDEFINLYKTIIAKLN